MIKLVNICPNFHRAEFKNVDIYFSYETIVAYRKDGYITAAKNQWGSTTGKHLNMISEKKDRLGYDDFMKKFKEEVLI